MDDSAEFSSPAGRYRPALLGLVLFIAGMALLLYGAGGISAFVAGVALILGLGLTVLELFVIPGIGPVAVAALVLIVFGLLGLVIPNGRAASLLNAGFGPLRVADGVVLLGAGGLLFGLRLVVQHALRLPVFDGLRLRTPSAERLSLPHPHPHTAQIGEIGIVAADLRPGGRVRFGDEVVDVRTRGEYVVAGTRVEVLKREGAAIIVRPVSLRPE